MKNRFDWVRDVVSPRRGWLRRLVRSYTLHFPVYIGKERLVHFLRHWFVVPGETLIDRMESGARIALDLQEHIQRYIFFFGYYEADLSRYVRSLLRPEMVFVDVGANIGQYTLLAAQSLGIEGIVYAFEPEPRNFAGLMGNIALNQFSNIEALQVAVADYGGETSFFVNLDDRDTLNCGTHSMRFKQEVGKQKEIKVKVTMLDQALADALRVDMIKIDTEGAELSVLRGAETILRKFKPRLFFEAEEVNTQAFGYSTVQLKEYVRSLGYVLYVLKNGKLLPSSSGIEAHTMIIGVPQELHQYA